jgi:ribosomal protein S27AE
MGVKIESLTKICPKCQTAFAKADIKRTDHGKKKRYCPHCGYQLDEKIFSHLIKPLRK